jgi:hypothetical protein
VFPKRNQLKKSFQNPAGVKEDRKKTSVLCLPNLIFHIKNTARQARMRKFSIKILRLDLFILNKHMNDIKIK